MKIFQTTKMLGVLLIFGVFVVVPLAGAQSLYEVDQGNGVVTFTTRRPSSGASYRTIGMKSPRFSKIYIAPRTSYKWKPAPRNTEFDSLIESIATEHGIEPALARAVVHVESYYNPYAVSPKGAMGLMQLMPGTARRYGVSDPWNPESNVRGGVKYLRWLLDRYKGNTKLAVAAYNAGEDPVDKLQGVPPYAETVEYVKRVTLALAAYRCKEDGSKDCTSTN